MNYEKKIKGAALYETSLFIPRPQALFSFIPAPTLKISWNLNEYVKS